MFSPFPVAILDRNVNYVIYSKKWQEYFGLESYGDLTGRNNYDIFPEILNIPEWLAVHNRVLCSGTVIRSDPKGERFETINGGTKVFRWWICPTYTRNYEDIDGMMMCVENVHDVEKEYEHPGDQQTWTPLTKNNHNIRL